MYELMEVLRRLPPLPCERCKGSGLITVTDVYWDAVVCWCSACNGRGVVAKDGAADGQNEGVAGC